MNLDHGPNFVLVLVVLPVLILALSNSPVVAGPEKGDKKCSDNIDNDGDGDYDCDDSDCAEYCAGDPGSGTCTGPDITAGWLNDAEASRIAENGTRPCRNSYLQTQGSYASYHCSRGGAEPPIHNLVAIDLSGVPWQQLKRKGDDKMCKLFNGGTEIDKDWRELTGIGIDPTDSYQLDFNGGPCDVNPCELRILHWFDLSSVGNEHLDAWHQGIGFFQFEAFVDLNPTAGTCDNCNPYACLLNINVSEVRITITKPGSRNRSECQYLLDGV